MHATLYRLIVHCLVAQFAAMTGFFLSRALNDELSWGPVVMGVFVTAGISIFCALRDPADIVRPRSSELEELHAQNARLQAELEKARVEERK